MATQTEITDLYALAHDPDAEWMSWALCPESDPELWHPPKGGSPRAAKRICAQCPVQDECLAWALERDEMGVWGGTTERERDRLKLAIAA